jgi:WD40 repeat protein/tetratricopeptide (TPR) repeat protein
LGLAEDLAPLTGYRSTWAVIVGIDRYPGGEAKLPALQFAVNDAREVRNLLHDEFGYPEDQIFYFADAAAEKEAILGCFDRLAGAGLEGPQPSDAVLFFFAGHGLIDQRSDESYLAAVDSHADRLASCVRVSEIRDRLAKLPCRHKLLILDSCYSGSLFQKDSQTSAGNLIAASAGRGDRGPLEERSTKSPTAVALAGPERGKLDNLAYYFQEPVFLGMSAGRLTPVADGQGESHHSVFTAALLQVLIERANSVRSDHAFSFRQLAAEVEHLVGNAPGSRQVPDWGWLDRGRGDFLFLPTVRRQTPRELSEERRRTAHQREVGLLVNQARRWRDEGDLLGSLPWLAEALILDQDDRDRAELQRLRLQLTLQQCPKLTNAFLHETQILDAEFSPDGRLVATACHDFTARLWDAATGEEKGLLQHDDPVVDVAFSPDGRHLATAASERTGRRGPGEARVWHVATGQPVTEPLRHQPRKSRVPGQPTPLEDYVIRNIGLVTRVEFSRDGTLLLTTGDDRTAHVWSVATGEDVKMLGPHPRNLIFAGYFDDGRKIVTIDEGPTARFWDADKFDALGESTVSEVSMPAISPDGKWLAARRDNAVMLWDVARGSERARVPLDGVAQCAASPDGKRLVLVGGDETARVWDLERGSWSTPPLRHPGIRRAGFSPDGRVIVTSGRGVRLWRAGSGQPAAPPIPGGDELAAWAPDGASIMTGAGGVATTWDVKLAAPFVQARERVGDVSRQRLTLATIGAADSESESFARLWDIERGRQLARPLEHPGTVHRALFSPDGSKLATLSDDGSSQQGKSAQVKIWDVPTSRALVSFEPGGEVADIIFSRDGRLLATGSRDGVARVWDADSGTPLTHPLLHEQPVNDVDLSPDGRFLVAATGPEVGFNTSLESSACVWELEDGSLAVPPLVQRGQVLQASFNSDGTRVMTVGKFNEGGGAIFPSEARLWDSHTGEAVAGPLGSEAMFSPDGTLVLDGAVLYSSQTGQESRRLEGRGLGFSADGRLLLVAQGDSDEGSLRLVTLSSGVASPPMTFPGRLLGATISPDGAFAAVACSVPNSRSEMELVLYQPASGEDFARFRLPFETDVHRDLQELFFSSDSRLLALVPHGGRWFALRLQPNNSSPEQLLFVSELHAGHEIDDSGNYLPIDFPKYWRERGKLLRNPERLAAGGIDAATWHHQQAGAAEAEYDRFGASHHLGALLAEDPANVDLLERRARASLELKRYEAAVADYSRVLEAGRKAPQLWRGRGTAFAGLKQWPNAVEDYTQAFDSGKDDFRVRLLRAIAHSEQGDERAAHADLEAVRRTCSDTLLEQELGRAILDQEALGNWAAANSLLDVLTTQRLSGMTIIGRADWGFRNDTAFAHRAFAKMQRGQWDAALNDYDEAIRLDPRVGWYWSGRANALAALGRGGDASQSLQEAVNRGADGAAIWKQIVATLSRVIEQHPDESTAWFFRGTARIKLEQNPEAVLDLTQAAKLNPQSFASRRNRGAAHINLGEWAEAESDFSEAIALDSRNPDYWRLRGIARLASGDHESAKTDFDEARARGGKAEQMWRDVVAEMDGAVTRAPDDARVWAARGWARLQLGQWKAAAADLSKALEIDPECAACYGWRAMTQAAQNELDAAIADFNRAIARGSQSVDVWIGRGDVYFRRREWAKAATDFANATMASPASARAWRALGQAELKRGRFEPALATSKKAVELEGERWEGWAGLGDVHAALKNFTQAARDYRKGIELGAASIDVWQKRAVATLAGGDADEYRDVCDTMFRRFGAADNLQTARTLVFSCTLTSDALSDFTPLVNLAERATKSAEESGALVAALYRAGRHARIVELADDETRGLDKHLPEAAHEFVAMAHWRTGQHEKAARWHSRAPGKIPADADWPLQTIRNILSEQAEKLLRSKP